MKRLFDILASFLGLLLLSPVLILVLFLIWIQDFRFPFYIAPRVAKGGGLFRMVKFRTMVIDADKTGVSSTSADDKRITWIGHIIRRYKLDEFSQLWNVLKGDMSLVGPRPQVKQDVELYTDEERRLLDLRPGITDLSSIVFSDEGDILEGSEDPDLRYNQVIRPWKSRLGLLYVEKRDFFVDIHIIMLTVISIISKPSALKGVTAILRKWDADAKLLQVVQRNNPLYPFPPPGASEVAHL